MDQNMRIEMEGCVSSPPTDRDCGTVGVGLSAGGGVKQTTEKSPNVFLYLLTVRFLWCGRIIIKGRIVVVHALQYVSNRPCLACNVIIKKKQKQNGTCDISSF